MEDIISKWLKEIANKESFEVYDNYYGEMILNNGNICFHQNSGSVYGIWICLDEKNKEIVFDDIKKKGLTFNIKYKRF